jgi:hypothetical protein
VRSDYKESIVSDEIRDKKSITEHESTRELRTADLAESGRPASRRIPIESEPERAGAASTEAGGANPARNPSSAATPATAVAPAKEQESGPLFSASEANQLRSRWDAVQVAFVD